MNRYKYLFRNLGILTIASFTTKLLGFFLVPLYTSILSTSEYGTYDLVNTTINLLVPILALNLWESILRFCLEGNYSEENLLSVAFKYCFIGLLILIVFVGFNSYYKWIRFLYSYPFVFVLLFISSTMVNITTAYARGIDKITEVAISGIIGAAITIILNIALLLVFNCGLLGYFVSTIIGTVIQSLYIVIRTHMWGKINFRIRDKVLEKIMLAYSIPLIANSVAWWINSASDRYIVSYLCGVEENGIYAVAYKIPSLLNMIQIIFNQAWIMSAVKEFNKEDNNGFFSTIYNIYNMLMVVCCSGLILFNKIIAGLLFRNEFYAAWKYVPFLLISVVFGAMSGYMGGIFSTTKKTDITAITVGIGAAINVSLNIVLVNLIGTLGAALATSISYIVVWICRRK